MKLYRCDLCTIEVTPKQAIIFKISGIKVDHICLDCRQFMLACMDLFKVKTRGKTFAQDVLESHMKVFPDAHKKQPVKKGA